MDYNDFDFIVVGSGFAGSVMAERVANSGRSVLVIEKRNVVGGNMYDYFDSATQTYIHKYGPHIFRTNSEQVWGYLSQFTKWVPYHHKVRSVIGNIYVPIPINLKSIQMLCNVDRSELLVIIHNHHPDKDELTIGEFGQINNPIIQMVYHTIYEKIYLNFSKKQWGKNPDEVDFKTITARIPIRLTDYDGYFTHTKQGLPNEGYSALFRHMLKHDKIKIITSADSKNILSFRNKNIFLNGTPYRGKMIYTGCIDELFDYSYGHLPYRSIIFKTIVKPVEYYQPVATLNYPDTYTFTRSTEFKYFTKTQGVPSTVIMREYPKDYEYKRNEDPFYPIPSNASQNIYQKYQRLSAQVQNLVLLGRLAEYKYHSMDEIVEKCLKYYKDIVSRS